MEMLTATVDQTTDLLSARLELDDDEIQRGFNVFMREHERSVANAIAAQVAALLENAPPLSVQVAAIPVLHGSALTVDIQRPRAIKGNGEDAGELLRAAPGMLIAEEGEPLGVIDAVGQEAIIVSVETRAELGFAMVRIRQHAAGGVWARSGSPRRWRSSSPTLRLTWRCLKMVLKLTLEYDGSNYSGWQLQPRHDSIQARIEAALETIFAAPMRVFGVGPHRRRRACARAGRLDFDSAPVRSRRIAARAERASACRHRGARHSRRARRFRSAPRRALASVRISRAES